MIDNNSTSIPNAPINSDWLKQLPSSIVLLDLDSRIVDATENWLKRFGLKENLIKGKTLSDIFPGLSDDWNTKLQYAREGLNDIQIMDEVRIENGGMKNFIWYLSPWKDGYGKGLGVVVKVKDATKTKELQLELNRTKNLLNEKGKIARIGSWEYNLQSGEVILSSVVEDIFGVSTKERLNLKQALLFYKRGDSRNRIKTLIEESIENGSSWNENLQLNNRDNQTFWVNTIGRPKFKDGKCARIIGTIQDITDKVLFKEDIHGDSNEKMDYSDIFEYSPVGMVITDYRTGRILDVNDALTIFTGFGKEELLGKLHSAFNIFENLGRKSSIIKQLKNKQSYSAFTVDFTDNKGKSSIVELKGKLIQSTENNTRVLTIVENVTNTKKQIAHLKNQVTEANANIEKLVNFTHMVSHNLKGHAANFSLLLNFLDKETLRKEQSELVTIMRESTENLTGTIKGLREIVSIRNNNKIKKEALVINDYIYKVEQGLTGIIKEEKAKIINEISDHLKVKAIPVYFESILNNCLSNSIKFRREGKNPVVIFSTEVTDDYTILAIEDNGMGMDLKGNKNKLFELGKTLSANKESRGMGLYLAKYQVELMNGKISVESTLGEGTTFKIFFSNK